MTLEYKTLELNGAFYFKRSYYAFYIPLLTDYSGLKQAALNDGYKVKDDAILELQKSFGIGWIGIAVQKKRREGDPNIKEIREEFNITQHTGSYKNLGKIYSQIMNDYPNATKFYNLYLNDPKLISEEELKTLILFK